MYFSLAKYIRRDIISLSLTSPLYKNAISKLAKLSGGLSSTGLTKCRKTKK